MCRSECTLKPAGLSGPLQAQGNRECPDAKLSHIVFNLLHARFVGESRIGIGLGMEWLSRIERTSVAAWYRGRGTEIAMNVEEFFGERVIRFHLRVSNGPGWGDSSLVVNDSKILGPHAE